MKNNIEDIPDASDDELKDRLLTPDGYGRRFKEQALDELISRAKRESAEEEFANGYGEAQREFEI